MALVKCRARAVRAVFARLAAIASVAAISCATVALPAQSFESRYVTMDDGVRLAIDVHFPKNHAAVDRRPALLELTRYWRAAIDPKTGKSMGGTEGLNRIDRGFLENGYIIIKVDVRGTGASFGHRMEEYGPREVRDGYAIVDWVASQSWCDANVGAYGISYSGTTAELICSSKHPALKAVIPGWSDFDLFESPGRPYGLCPYSLMGQWGQMVGWMDENNVEKMRGSVRPVDPSLLSAAIKDHEVNPDVAELEAQAEFRDVGYLGGRPMAECTSVFWKQDIEASNVPMLVLASWLDAGTADGALLRFQHYRNPQYLIILASSHGGMTHASPYAVSDTPLEPVPSGPEQFALWLAFMNHFLKHEENEVSSWPKVRYFNMGEEIMLQSESWPPPGTQPQLFYFGPENSLQEQTPDQVEEADKYQVDFDVNTGTSNRWMTQMGMPVLNLDRREAMDARMLCYTSKPLEKDLQITGTPEVHLWLRSTKSEGAVLAYLEDVAPDGQSRYISEGGLRFLHRKVSANVALPKTVLPHSFAQADAQVFVAGVDTEVLFKMWPTSVRIEAGHRVRVAIAGADQTTFTQLPSGGDVELTISRNSKHASHVVLPIVDQR